LRFLHHHALSGNRKLVHGDIRGVNVLVDMDERALLCDFGMFNVSDVYGFDNEAALGRNTRWLAYELFKKDEGKADPTTTPATDVYAFGCICYEVFTGVYPYYELRDEFQVLWAKNENTMPERRPSIPDDIWSLMTDCWSVEPSARPDSKQLVVRLKALGKSRRDA